MPQMRGLNGIVHLHPVGALLGFVCSPLGYGPSQDTHPARRTSENVGDRCAHIILIKLPAVSQAYQDQIDAPPFRLLDDRRASVSGLEHLTLDLLLPEIIHRDTFGAEDIHFRILHSIPAGDLWIGKQGRGSLAADNPLLSFLKQQEIERILESQLPIENQLDWGKRSYLVKVSPLVENTARLLINISDITAQRRPAKQEYEEAKTRALSTLVAGLAHEIRNPLTSVKTFIEMIPSKLSNPIFRQRLTEVLPHEIGRIEQLVQELLEYARHREADPKLCDLESTLNPVIDLLAIECERQGVDLKVGLQGEVYCDPRHLVQIVLNLGLNSLKAVAAGEQILLYSALIDNEVRITVEDTGCGIPPQYHAQLFDPFFSLQGGTGMGLALVAQMVGENQGRITFESKEGQGTHFHIWLPAKPGEVV